MARWSHIDIRRSPTAPKASGASGSGNASSAPEPAQSNRDTLIVRRRISASLIALVALIGGYSLLAGSGSSHAHAAHRTASKLTVKHPALRTKAMLQAEEQAAVRHVLSYTPAVVSGGNRGNEVALTFDDGPGPYTLKLVETLDRLHVQATFFVIGEMERYFSAGTLAELRSGDVIGDHTETHPMMATLSAHEQQEQLNEQIARIEVLGAPRPILFRPPYGSFNATTFKQLRRQHLLMVLWSTDTSDYSMPGVQAIISSALAGAHPGAIILMHDGGGNRSETIEALPGIIAGLRKRHLQPVTVPRLMLDDPPPPGQPIPTNLSGA